MRQIILDTETTGLSWADGDRVIEIGCVELLNRQLTGNNLHYYLKVDRDSHPDALRVHGITTEFLRDKPGFEQVVDEFLHFLHDAELIIHNAPFDVGFLDSELRRIGRPPLGQHVLGVVDSLVLAKSHFPGKRNSLDALCDRFDIDKSSRTLHGALLDSELLARVYIHLTRGQEALLVSGEEEATEQPDSQQPQAQDASPLDFALALDLPVVYACEQELQAHEAVLAGIDKDSQQATVWRQLSTTV